ncbi:MAG TPA: ACP S-malonyltransferase [Baekduia sp.]|nr:ACP S-malonyltransferase [Baekduia sp.]
MPRVAAIFPGQGSHATGMEEPWAASETITSGLEILGFNPFEKLEEGTRYQQPAIFLCSVAAWREEQDAGDVVAAAGHSLGEYAALVAAEVLSFEDALPLVAERAAAMAEAGDDKPGSMIAFLGGEDSDIRALARDLDLTVANDNAPGQLILSGAIDMIEKADEVGRDSTGARTRRLDVSGAFHSPLMGGAADRLTAALEKATFNEPRFPVYSNGTAAPFTDARDELAANLLRGVRWRETLLAMSSEGVDRFAEYGHGSVLSGLVKRTLGVPA